MELAGLNIKFLPGVGEKKAAVLYEELQVQSYEWVKILDQVI